MVELKRIRPKEIRQAAHKKDLQYDKDGYLIEDKTTHLPSWVDEMLDYGMTVFESVLDAQLEADQEKVRAIFEEIEQHLFTFDGNGNLILTSAPPRDRIVIWWQAFKQRYVE